MAAKMTNDIRDFIGYGQQGADFSWPNNAQLAINFVINYESGAELSFAEQDNESESYLTDIPGTIPTPGHRNLSVESTFEYGSRCGIWRLHRLFDHHKIPTTVFACGRALEHNPAYCQYLKNSPHEVAGHGYRWIHYKNLTKDIERQHIQNTIDIIQRETGKSVSGFYTGRKSKNTTELYRDFNLRYHSDSYADDLPYWSTTKKQPQLVIPYNLVTNDFRFATTPGFTASKQFYEELLSAFNFQYAEGKTRPQLLTIGLHERLSGRPSRTQALKLFLQMITDKPNLWICTRADIAEHWYNNYRPGEKT